MGNPFHDAKTGEFSSGSDAAASGDHQGAQPANKDARNVPGHGTLPRSKPVAMHAGRQSVGTSGGGGGGGGSGGGGSGSGGSGSIKKKLKSAKDETVAMRQQIDERHYPTVPDSSRRERRPVNLTSYR